MDIHKLSFAVDALYWSALGVASTFFVITGLHVFRMIVQYFRCKQGRHKYQFLSDGLQICEGCFNVLDTPPGGRP